MRLHKYKNYDEYKKVQEEGNKKKINRQYCQKDEIKFLSDYLKTKSTDIKFGICHGTRRGNEQSWFREYLDADVIGTEISETANQFPHTIQWDFHETKEEWLNNTDFIYSNSLDHSYDPSMCLKKWMSCIKEGGICIIQWDQHYTDDYSRELDPFGASLDEYKQMIIELGFSVKEIIKHPKKDIKYIII